MAIAEMSRLTLVGLKSDKNAILEALQRTGAVQITCTDSYELAGRGEESPSLPEVSAAIDRTERALGYLAKEIDDAPKTVRAEGVAKDGIAVSSDEFFDVGKHISEYEEILCNIEKLAERRSSVKSGKIALMTERGNFEDYECLNDSFASFSDTLSAKVYLGIVPAEKTAALTDGFSDLERAYCRVIGTARRGNVVFAVVYKSDKDAAENVLSANGFIKCTIAEDVLPERKIAEINEKIDRCDAEGENISADACKMAPLTVKIKIYLDYLCFLKEKYELEESFSNTESAFVLSAYVPSEAAERVRGAIEKTARASYIDISVINRNEFAPTLMKNNRRVRNFEAVTNMYSAPAYGALDPNGVMGFFFSLFMGLIMADVGYGIMMIAGGFIFAGKQREGTTVNRMAKVFAYGGIFAVLFGILFDSWLGMSLLRGNEGYYASVLPATAASVYKNFYLRYIDPITAGSTIMGIGVPSVLLWCLGLGTLHIAVSLILKAVQCFERKQILTGIFGGIVWALALIAFIVWVFCIAAEIQSVGNIAMYTAAALAGLGILTAGITEKGAGKVIKVFTSAYGLINYASDILSYARLYGLMLSGAQIASIFTNTLAIQMLFPTGVFGVVFGVVIIIIGNVFNIAMSLLGAFIHDSRLQYVEFFGRFYEGEGELFKPFGRVYEHIYFK